MTDQDCLLAPPRVRPVAVSHVSGTWWRRPATKMMVTGVVLAGMAAGCSSQPAVTGGSTTSCYLFALSAVQRHVPVTSVPAACQGLSPVQVNVAVGRALRAATARARGKVAQRELIARDLPYVAGLLTWIGYVATGLAGLAGVACGLLLVVASLGMTLVFLGPGGAAAETRPGDDPRPAGRPPVPVIAAHVIAACITILLATLAAIGSG